METAGGGGNGAGMQRSQTQNMGRQGSLYGLTLNEVQNHLGEPLQSMNLDEFLRTVFPAEANQGHGMVIEGFSPYASGSDLQRQASIGVRHSMTKKTVDDVWRDIQQGRQKKGLSIEDRRLGHERQPTLGEMTLEDFLAKAGVGPEGSSTKHKDNVGLAGMANSVAGVQDFSQSTHWLNPYHHMQSMDQQQQVQQNVLEGYMPGRPIPQSLGIGAGPMLESVYPDSQINISSPTLGALSDSHMTGGKQVVSGDITDKLVDRRQKRMIKNRESAARSRARKQAYTNELENKVSRLEEENKRLKKQKEFDEMPHCASPKEPKYRLRRTSSGQF